MAAVKHASNLGSDQMADLSHEASGPLAGTRIVDLTTILLGPVATQMLGEHSVEVLVEIGYAQAEIDALVELGVTADGSRYG